MSTRCDIILCADKDARAVDDCLRSVLDSAAAARCVIEVVDCGCDALTRRLLEDRAREHRQVRLSWSRESPATDSARSGAAEDAAPFVAILLPGLIVSPDWLDGLLRCAESSESAPGIACTHPLTSRELQLPPGSNPFGLHEFLQRESVPSYPDSLPGSLWCALFRRDVLSGGEIAACGCDAKAWAGVAARLVSAGQRVALADDVYVYLDSRSCQEAAPGTNPRLPAVTALRSQLAVPSGWAPRSHLRKTYRRLRTHWHGREFAGLAAEIVRSSRGLLAERRSRVLEERVAALSRPDRLRVTYVVDKLALNGGVISILQLVNELILLGVEARIAAVHDYPELAEWPLLTEPMLFPSGPALTAGLPACDVAVATHWVTAAWVSAIVESDRARAGCYFIQDYEAWFEAPGDTESRDRVLATYPLIPNRIVKSQWLRTMLLQHDVQAHQIPLGMDLRVFQPRAVARSPRLRVVAMARPGTPWRGTPYVIEAFAQVAREMPEVELVFFGADLPAGAVPFPHRSEGVIRDRDRLAELYSSADVYLDGSDFQGFGRTGLEAMACGCACVLTDVGGVNEYAVGGANCVLVPPRQPSAFASAILELLRDAGQRRRLIAAGRETAGRYSHVREADETRAYFSRIAAD